MSRLNVVRGIPILKVGLLINKFRDEELLREKERERKRSFLSPLYYKFAEYSKNNRLFREEREIASTFYSVVVAIWIRALERPERSVESAIYTYIEKLRACRHNFNRVSQTLGLEFSWNNAALCIYFARYGIIISQNIIKQISVSHRHCDYDYASFAKVAIYKIPTLASRVIENLFALHMWKNY